MSVTHNTSFPLLYSLLHAVLTTQLPYDVLHIAISLKLTDFQQLNELKISPHLCLPHTATSGKKLGEYASETLTESDAPAHTQTTERTYKHA